MPHDFMIVRDQNPEKAEHMSPQNQSRTCAGSLTQASTLVHTLNYVDGQLLSRRVETPYILAFIDKCNTSKLWHSPGGSTYLL